jgi:hypothetical protein
MTLNGKGKSVNLINEETKNMKVEVRITTEEEMELIVTKNSDEDLIDLTVGDQTMVVSVNKEELKHALRIMEAK